MMLISGCGQSFCTCAMVPYRFTSSGYATGLISLQVFDPVCMLSVADVLETAVLHVCKFTIHYIRIYRM